MASKNALVRREVQLARARSNTTAAVSRTNARANQRIDGLKKRLANVQASAATNVALGIGFIGLGVVAGGQVARMQLFPTDEGKSRAPWLNYLAGAVGGFVLVSGRARSAEAMGAACMGVGMGLAQLGLTSFKEWDLVPGDTFGA